MNPYPSARRVSGRYGVERVRAVAATALRER